MRITAVTPFGQITSKRPPDIRIAAETPSLPQPPMAGFSPLIAIVTSDRRSSDDFDWEHALASSYVGKPLNAPAEQNFVVGILDTGSVVDLAAGRQRPDPGPERLPPDGERISHRRRQRDHGHDHHQPIGVFAAGLGAIKPERPTRSVQAGRAHERRRPGLAPDRLRQRRDVSAIVGTPLLAFYTTIIHVDQPRRVVVRGKTYIGPDIQITDSYTPPTSVYRHKIPMELGGLSPVATASYYAFPDLSRLGEHPGRVAPLDANPAVDGRHDAPHGRLVLRRRGRAAGPTRAAEYPADRPDARRYRRPKLDHQLEHRRQAEPAPGAGLHRPDLRRRRVSEVPGYYLDYVRIDAMGGALEFAHVPFIVLDMESPEGGSLDGILGMNLFWNRNVVLEPTTSGSGFLHVSDPVPYAYIDLNFDDVVDGMDFAIFAAAWRTTPADPAWNPCATCSSTRSSTPATWKPSWTPGQTRCRSSLRRMGFSPCGDSPYRGKEQHGLKPILQTSSTPG